MPYCRLDFDHFGLKIIGNVIHSVFALGSCILFTSNYISFPHQHYWQNCYPSQMFTQVETNSILTIAGVIQILELSTDFKEMKRGIDILLR